MRNFFRFISRFFNLIFFIVLEICCAVLIARTSYRDDSMGTIQGDDLISSSNAVSGFMYKRQNELYYYFGLGKMNDSLLSENRRLREEIARLRYSTDTFRDSVVTRPVRLQDSGRVVEYAKYVYRNALVINNSVSQRNNFITINRGEEDGIRKEMSVISGTGAVGRIVHTSKHFATAISILNTQVNLSVHLKDGTRGLASWIVEGQPFRMDPDRYYVPNIPAEVPMHLGDSVWTTTDSYFPPDILVGVIQEVRKVNKTGKRILYLRPATNFRNLQYVYVVDDSYQPERRALEAQTLPAAAKPKTGKKK